MQLPDFIKRALAFFDTAEAHLKADQSSKARISELEAGARKLADELAQANKDKAGLQLKLDQAATDIATKDQEIAGLKGDVVKANGKANAVIAGQGVPIDQLPSSDPGPGGQANENAWNKYQRLLVENPRAAGAFWASNADQIMAARLAAGK